MRLIVSEGNLLPWLARDERLVGVDLVEADYRDTASVTALLAGADGYVGVYVTSPMIEAIAKSPFLLQVAAAGVDHVDLDSLPAGVQVCNAGGHDRSIAEYVLMVLLASIRDLRGHDAALRRGVWRSRLVDPAEPHFDTLGSRTVGIIGFGSIGQDVARVLTGLGARCLAVTRNPDKPRPTDVPLGWIKGMDSVGELFEQSDVIVVGCPLTEETRGLVDSHLLASLGSNGIFINVGRGAVADEHALYEALRAGTIASAALDVWAVAAAPGVQMPSALPFHELDNVIITPHYSATAEQTYRDRASIIADNIERFWRGHAPLTLVRQT